MLHLSKRLLKSNISPFTRALSTVQPKPVSDDMVKVNFINYKGQRTTLTGLVGENLLEICRNHMIYDLLEDTVEVARVDFPAYIQRTERWVENTFHTGFDTYYSQ